MPVLVSRPRGLGLAVYYAPWALVASAWNCLRISGFENGLEKGQGGYVGAVVHGLYFTRYQMLCLLDADLCSLKKKKLLLLMPLGLWPLIFYETSYFHSSLGFPLLSSVPLPAL